jgi:hypothetical protein
MESWQFIQSPAGGWYWLCSDVISRKTRTSTAMFKTRMECVADAMGYGYQNGPGVAAEAPTARPGAPRFARPQGKPGPKPASRNRSARRNRKKSG